MEVVKNNVNEQNNTENNNEQQKLTYDQLNQVCQELFQQNQKLNAQVKDLSLYNTFKRIDYLFKVVELSSAFKNPDFVAACTDELVTALTPAPEAQATEEKKD